MNIIRIPKRNGEYRTIYVPNADERRVLNERLPQIKDAAEAINYASGGFQHGFQPARSPVTNALQHINFDYTLTMDLKDFFDSVTPNMVPENIRFPECFPDGAARQGLPTSPALANIAACRMDREIFSRYSMSVDEQVERVIMLDFDSYAPVTYTRYADDLTFSSNSLQRLEWLRDIIPAIARRHGFEVKTSKTRIQWAGAGRRMITGIAVDSKLHPMRSTKRRLRAARHQRHTAEARGLAEWMELRPPKNYNSTLWKQNTNPQLQRQGQTLSTNVAPEITTSPEGTERIFTFQHNDQTQNQHE